MSTGRTFQEAFAPSLAENARTRAATAASQQDTAVVHCVGCGQTHATFNIVCHGDYSEKNVWQETKLAAEAQGWQLINLSVAKLPRAKPTQVQLESAWLCPVCVQRRKQPSPYPKFRGKKCCCPKCAEQPVAIKYEPMPYEHLRRLCTTCGFEWNERTHCSWIDRIVAVLGL